MRRISTNGLRACRALAFALGLVSVTACFPAEAMKNKAPPVLTQEEARFAQQFLDDEISGPAYRAVEASFPYVWKTFIETAKSSLESGEKPNEAGAKAGVVIDEGVALYASALRVVPTDEAWNLILAKRDLTQALQTEDLHSCAVYARGGSLPSGEGMSESLFRKAWAEKAAYYRAVAAGKERPVFRPDLSDSKKEAIIQLARRVAAPSAEQSSPSLTQDQKNCAQGVHTYETLATGNREQAVILFIELLPPLAREKP